MTGLSTVTRWFADCTHCSSGNTEEQHCNSE